MPKSPGELNRKISFETITSGGEDTGWNTTRYEFAKVTEIDTYSAEFEVYYFNLDPNTMRIVFEGNVYEITQVSADERRRYLTIQATRPEEKTLGGD